GVRRRDEPGASGGGDARRRHQPQRARDRPVLLSPGGRGARRFQPERRRVRVRGDRDQAAGRPVLRIKKAHADLIEWERIGRVATAGPTGMPHVVPVCHILLDGKIYFASAIEGRKMDNLAANPRISIVFEHYTDVWPNKGVMVQGRASLIRRGPRFRKIRRLLYAKFPQYPGRAALDESDSVMIEVTPTRVFAWGIE